MQGRSSILGLALLGLLACGPGEPAPEPGPTPSEALGRITAGPHDRAVFDLGELGTIEVELLPEISPKSVAYFTRLANEGYYDGTYFHRVIPQFMIQGGDPNTRNNDPRDDGQGHPDTQVEDEFTDYPYTRGTLALANTGSSGTNGSQFFIVHEDSPHLDGSYNVLGRVVSGIEVVDEVTRLEIDVYGRYGPSNRPYPVNATLVKLRVEAAATAATDDDAPAVVDDADEDAEA